MHISRLLKHEDEFLIAFSEEDALRFGLEEGGTIHFDLKKIDDPASVLTEREIEKMDREYESFKKYLETTGS